MGVIKDSFTFDDVTLVPQYSAVLPSETITVSKLSNNLNLQIPLISSAMDTVTESKMAIAISRSGGIGIVHRNLSIEKQVVEVDEVATGHLLVSGSLEVSGAISSIGGIKIGPSEDNSYSDGLFTDVTSNTTVGTVVDRFNEILKALAPGPAPSLQHP